MVEPVLSMLLTDIVLEPFLTNMQRPQRTYQNYPYNVLKNELELM